MAPASEKPDSLPDEHGNKRQASSIVAARIRPQRLHAKNTTAYCIAPLCQAAALSGLKACIRTERRAACGKGLRKASKLWLLLLFGWLALAESAVALDLKSKPRLLLIR